MNITTKFAPGETVWTINNGKAVEGEIVKIEITVFKDAPVIEYQVKSSYFGHGHIKESQLFATKEDLIASL